MDFNPVTDDIGLMIPPPANNEGSALNVLELAPGLAVKIRYINNNWHLVPTTAPVDVEGLIVDRLVAKLRHPAEISYDEICCLLNAVANRRDSLINAWRNVQGLLGTDKPLPLSEISPLAMVEDEDKIINALPTGESTGNEIFDYIEYNYDCFNKGDYYAHIRWGIAALYLGYNEFVIDDRVSVQLFKEIDNQPVSPKFEIQLKHRGPDQQGMCVPIDPWLIYSKSYPGGPDSTEWFSSIKRHMEWHGPVYEGSCAHLGTQFPGFPGGDAVQLSLRVSREIAPGNFVAVEDNKYYVKVEFVDKSKRQHGVNLTLNYFNHEIGDIVTEIRAYSKYYRDRSLMQYVMAEELKVLDEMRVQALINGPQWISAKQQLESLSQADVICPSEPIIPIIEPLPPGPPPVVLPPPIIPPIPELPEIPPIILPPIEIPPIAGPPPITSPILPIKICEKDILEGRWL